MRGIYLVLVFKYHLHVERKHPPMEYSLIIFPKKTHLFQRILNAMSNASSHFNWSKFQIFSTHVRIICSLDLINP